MESDRPEHIERGQELARKRVELQAQKLENAARKLTPSAFPAVEPDTLPSRKQHDAATRAVSRETYQTIVDRTKKPKP